MLTALWIFTFVAIVLNGVRLRMRAAALAEIGEGPPQVDEEAVNRHVTVAADGVVLSPATRAAAIAFAQRAGLDVVDLIPGDLPVERALNVLRLVDPTTYRKSKFVDGAGGFQAVVAASAVWERAGVAERESLDPAALLRIARRLKPYACTTADVAVAPALRASEETPALRWAWMRQLFQRFASLSLIVQFVQLTILFSGPFVRPFWGTLALIAYCVQPYVVFAGTALAPRDLAVQILRPFLVLSTWMRTVLAAAANRGRTPDPAVALIPEYERLLAGGTARFFELRRTDCPICVSHRLRPWISVGDLLQHKPGRFRLEICEECGHIFQNPRLSIEGLDFYYKDFYDGLSEDFANMIFSAPGQKYTERAEMLKGLTTPERWLDVGAGHGHFCRNAMDTWPQTQFDGLDMSRSIDEAQRRGWVAHGYRGMFPEMAAQLAGQYDVVSMHHYLEHTREPLDELAAAVKVLKPGGYFLIEVPDPECELGRLLGRFWLPWFQPQHQHFISIGNLQKELGKLGFEVVKTERAMAHQAVEFGFAGLALLQTIAPPTHLPWRAAQAGPWARLQRTIVLAIGWPLPVAGLLCDRLCDFLVHRGAVGSNTYRVLARLTPREGESEVDDGNAQRRRA